MPIIPQAGVISLNLSDTPPEYTRAMPTPSSHNAWISELTDLQETHQPYAPIFLHQSITNV